LDRRNHGRSHGAPARWQGRWVLLACAAILVVGTGGAATLIWRTHALPPEGPKEAPKAVESRHLPSRATPSAAPEPSSASENAEEATAPAPAAPRSIRKMVRATPDESPKASSAADLFARANSLRRQNDTTEALRVYRELQHTYPGSAEELVSRVTLGRL